MITAIESLLPRKMNRNVNRKSWMLRMMLIIFIGLCANTFSFGQLDNDTKNESAPVISLWKVDRAHLENHNEGTSYYLECGAESYLKYQGAGTSEEIIIVILNEGKESLKLSLPLTLEAKGNDAYEIVHQPAKTSLAPNEKTHFIVKYTAPNTYQDDKAKVYIKNNDANHPICELNLDVGIGVFWNKVFSPDVIGPGSVSRLTFTITNTDLIPASDLAFTDTYPAGMLIADPPNASTNCGNFSMLSAPASGSTLTFSDGVIAGGQSCTVSVDVTSSTPGTHTNTSGNLTSSAGNSGTATDDLEVSTSLPGFSKSFAPSTVPLGGRSTLTFLIDNTANASKLTNLDFTDVMPGGMEIANPANASTDCGTTTVPPTLTAIEGTNTVTLDANGTFAFPALDAGATCTVTVDVVATGTGALDNISGELQADFVSSGKASATLDVTVTPISIEKKFVDDPTPPGGTVQLDFKLINFDRNFPATSVAFMDDLNATLTGLTFDSVLSNDCGGTVSGAGTSTIGLSMGTIAPGASCVISTSLTVPLAATPGIYNNTTGAVTGIIDGNPITGNMASDDLFAEPIPILIKEFLEDGTLAPDPVVNPGDDVVLRFTVTNTSMTSSATDISFFDELTDGSSAIPADNTSGFFPFPVTVSLPPNPDPPCGAGSSLTLEAFDTDRHRLSLTGGTLPASGSCTFELTVSVPSDMGPGNYLNTTEEITATVDGATRTGIPASDNLIIVSAPQLSKEFIDDPVAPGETVTLQFTLSHSDDAAGDATDISFTDDLTFLAGLTASLPVSPDPPCGVGSSLTGSAGDTFLTLAGASLMPGEDCTFDVTLNVPAGAAPGSHTNTTSNVSATVGGITTTSAPASDDLDVSKLVFTKEFIGDPHIAGGSGTLRFTIDNQSITDATGISFTDVLGQIFPGTPDLMITTALPASVCGGTISIAGTTLSFSGGSVTANSNCFFDLDYDVPVGIADGTYTNVTSSLSSSLGTASPAIDQITVNSNLIGLSKSFTNDPVSPGDPVTLKFTLTNLDAAQAVSAIAFTDDLGATLSGLVATGLPFAACGGTVDAIPGAGTINFSGGSLAAAANCSFDVILDVPGGAIAGNYTNTTSAVTGTIGGLGVTGDPASDILDIIDLLTFSKSFDGPTTATGTASLTFTITNPGPNVASDLEFIDSLEAVLSGLVATNLPLTNVCGAGSMIIGTSTISFSGGSLAPMGGTCSFIVDLLIPASASAGTYPNTTSNIFQSGLIVANPATANLVVEPPPTFAKVFAPDSNNPGEVSTLTFTIDNSASVLAATALNFTDNLPANVIVATPANASTTCMGGTLTAADGSGTITYTGGSVGAMSSCTVQVDVTSSVVGSYTNTTSDLTSSSGNSGTASDTWSIICDPGDMSSISGTTAVCQGSDAPDVTFTFTGGIAPYTFTYKINGGADQMVTTTMGNSVTVAHSTAMSGMFTYTLVSAVDNNGCPGIPSGSAVITVYPLPTATISGTTTVCEADANPNITFTGAGGTAPYTFTYKINGGADQMVTTTMGNSVTIAQSTAMPDIFTYTLVSVSDANMCSQIQMGSAVITVNPLPTATIGGTITVCEADANPIITFTGAGGTAPYTFTYKINGGVDQGVTTTMGNSATVAQSTATPDVFTYTLVSVEDANMCIQTQTGSAVITVNPLPTATVSGTTALCLGSTNPDVTFTGAAGTAPYTFTYKINGGVDQMVTTTMGNSVTVSQSTAISDVFTYTLVSVQDANSCSQAQTGSAVITVYPLPTATIGGTASVCQGSAAPDISFTGAAGTPPYTFTYKVNGGPDQMISTAVGSSVTVSQSTAVPDTFTYTLVSVSDANMCSQTQAGSAVITVAPQPGLPGPITGPMFTCPGLDNVPYEIATTSNTTSYDWTFTDNSVVINGNGTNKVTLDGITVAGTLSVVSTNSCGSSLPATFDIKVSSPDVCVLADCSRNGIFIDDEILGLFEGTDIFKAIETIESDATILSGSVKIFRAGENIDFYPPFTVEEGAVFIAEIESCFTKNLRINQKR